LSVVGNNPRCFANKIINLFAVVKRTIKYIKFVVEGEGTQTQASNADANAYNPLTNLSLLPNQAIEISSII
jgi:hypothetical protein